MPKSTKVTIKMSSGQVLAASRRAGPQPIPWLESPIQPVAVRARPKARLATKMTQAAREATRCQAPMGAGAAQGSSASPKSSPLLAAAAPEAPSSAGGLAADTGISRANTRAATTPTAAAVRVLTTVGKKMELGAVEPKEARSAIMPVGSTASPEVLMAKNRTMASVATPGRTLSLLSSRMARRPKGVAALPRPIMLLAMLSTIMPKAGWSLGTVGKRDTITGRSSAAMRRMRPASCSTRMSPSHRAITPTSPKASATAEVALWVEARATSPKRWVQAPQATLSKSITIHRVLSMGHLYRSSAPFATDHGPGGTVGPSRGASAVATAKPWRWPRRKRPQPSRLTSPKAGVSLCCQVSASRWTTCGNARA